MFIITQNVIMVSVIMLKVVTVSAIMLNVVMLNVVAPFQAAGKKVFNPQAQTLQLILSELQRKKFYCIRPR
jgi:hypothetical protein